VTRTIELALNRFPSPLPATLLDRATNDPLEELNVDAKALFHHYFLAKYGDGAEDIGVYEYERMLTGGGDWRYLGSGIGRDKEAKRNVSNELGKGFARWFLYEHFGHTYFCPFDDVLDRKNPDGTTWIRTEDGDLPDYVCGKNTNDPNLLEAKGRYRSVTFRTKEFETFREQIQRARLVDGQGRPIRIKGFIGAARWATQETPRVQSKLWVEDPSTEGEPPGEQGYPREVGLSMVAGHFAPVLERLQLPAVAEAIRNLQPLPERRGGSRGLWECVSGPLRGSRFVGGMIPDRLAVAWEPWWPFFDFDERELRHFWRFRRRAAPFVLSRPPLFFGLEETVFNKVVGVARRGLDAASEIEQVRVPEQTGSLSLLRDGTVLGPVTYFEPIGVAEV
jgi:hypothetical protein